MDTIEMHTQLQIGVPRSDMCDGIILISTYSSWHANHLLYLWL